MFSPNTFRRDHERFNPIVQDMDTIDFLRYQVKKQVEELKAFLNKLPADSQSESISVAKNAESAGIIRPGASPS